MPANQWIPMPNAPCKKCNTVGQVLSKEHAAENFHHHCAACSQSWKTKEALAE